MGAPFLTSETTVYIYIPIVTFPPGGYCVTTVRPVRPLVRPTVPCFSPTTWTRSCRHWELSSWLFRSILRGDHHPPLLLIKKIERPIPFVQNVLKALQPRRRTHFHHLRSRASNNQTLKADWPIHSLQGPKPTTKSNALKAAGPSHSFQTLIERKAKGKTFKAAGPSHPFQALVELAPEGKHNACANLSP